MLEDLPERERMLWGTIAYLCFPVSLYYARWDPFVRFHVRQGAGVVIVLVLARIWHRVTDSNEIPEVAWLGYAAATVLACYGIRNALALEYRSTPWIGWMVHRWLPLPKRLAEPARVSAKRASTRS